MRFSARYSIASPARAEYSTSELGAIRHVDVHAIATFALGNLDRRALPLQIAMEQRQVERRMRMEVDDDFPILARSIDSETDPPSRAPPAS
jgi:hypothetical protein